MRRALAYARLVWNILGTRGSAMPTPADIPRTGQPITFVIAVTPRPIDELALDIKIAKAGLDYSRRRKPSHDPVNNPLRDDHPDVKALNRALEAWAAANTA